MSKIGEVFINKYNQKIEIIEYFGANDCTIRYESGVIKEKVQYRRLKRGFYRDFTTKIGEKSISNQGYVLEIIDYIDFNRCKVLVNNHSVVDNVTYNNFKLGGVGYVYHKSVCNVGFLGEGKADFISYSVPYKVWKSMIVRCYDNKYLQKQPTYKDVTVCEEWHNFQNFAKWFEENWKPWMDNYWQLDKDILVKGNKIYSPDTCCFVPRELNSLIKCNYNKKSDLPIGVIERKGKFIARLGKDRNYIGSYTTLKEAFQAYKTTKEAYIKEASDKWKDKIDTRVYEALYNYQVEITNNQKE